MKHFFEQYGGVALGILALLVLIAMITPVGNIIKTSLQGTVQTFSSGMESQTDNMIKTFENVIHDTEKGFSGFKNEKFYQFGQPVAFLSDKTTNNDKTLFIDENNMTYEIYIDVDVVIDENLYCSGYPDLTFDVYKNGELFRANISDFFEPISIKENDKYTIIISNCPDNVILENSNIDINLYDMTIVPSGENTRYDFETQIKGLRRR